MRNPRVRTGRPRTDSVPVPCAVLSPRKTKRCPRTCNGAIESARSRRSRPSTFEDRRETDAVAVDGAISSLREGGFEDGGDAAAVTGARRTVPQTRSEPGPCTRRSGRSRRRRSRVVLSADPLISDAREDEWLVVSGLESGSRCGFCASSRAEKNVHGWSSTSSSSRSFSLSSPAAESSPFSFRSSGTPHSSTISKPAVRNCSRVASAPAMSHSVRTPLSSQSGFSPAHSFVPSHSSIRPPGRTTRANSSTTAWWSSIGTWITDQYATTASNVELSNGSVVISPCTRTASGAFSAARFSCSREKSTPTAVLASLSRVRTGVPCPQPASRTRPDRTATRETAPGFAFPDRSRIGVRRTCRLSRRTTDERRLSRPLPTVTEPRLFNLCVVCETHASSLAGRSSTVVAGRLPLVGVPLRERGQRPAAV